DLALPDGYVSDYQELVPVRGFEETVDGKTQRVLLQEAGSGIAATIDPNGFTALYDTTLAAFRSRSEERRVGKARCTPTRTEHGIRDRNVTGVQTCALPICDLALPDGYVSDYQELVPVRGFEETVDGKTQRVLLQEAGSGIAATIDPNGFTALYDTTLAAFRS